MSKVGDSLMKGMKEALAIAREEQPAARLHVGGHAYVPEASFAWRAMNEAPKSKGVLLLLGEAIPDLADVRVGTLIGGSEAEELGYREYAKYGGWLIWNDASDFYVIDIIAPRAWMEMPPVDFSRV